MAAPQIDNRTSLQTARAGEAYALQLAALGDVDTWTALHLPAGLSIDDETGLIDGTVDDAIAPGTLYQVLVQAENVDGASQIVLLILVLASDASLAEWSDLELDFDLITRRVSIPGVSPGVGEPLFSIARGDKLNLLFGFLKRGTYVDVKPGDETVGLKLVLKEFAPEINLTSVGGVPEKVGTGERARFRIPAWIRPDDWSVLSDYESDRKTGLISVGEAELTVGDAVDLYDETETDDLSLHGGIGLGGYFDDAIETTLVFTGLTETGAAGYTLAISLVVTGRAGQNVALSFTLDIAKPSTVWVVTNLTGDDTIQGAVEGDAWRVTIEVTDVTGDADSVDVDVRITTTEDVEAPAFVTFGPSGFTQPEPGEDEQLEIAVEAPEIELQLWDGTSQIGASWVPANTYDTPAAFAAALETAWETRTGIADVADVTWTLSPIRFTVHLADSTAVTRIRWGSSPSEYIAVSPASSEGDTAAAVLTGQLTQVSTESDQPLRFTSLPIDIEVIADNIPDSE